MGKIKTVVLDASVLFKVIFQEEDSDKATKLVNSKENFKLSVLIPDFFKYEFFQQATRKLGATAAEEAYASLTSRQVSSIPLAKEITKTAQKIMQKNNKIAFYDAAYHALAKIYGVDLITADKRYYDLTKKEGNIKLLRDLKL